MDKINKVAVFIDAENVSHRTAEQIFKEASDRGDVIIKKIFGDWSTTNLFSWKEMIAKYSIKCVQQHSFAKKRNTSDISLMLEVMLALFERDIDVFCIASSDSDFTSLIVELKERNKKVVGMGMRETSIQSYVNSFTEFIYLNEMEDDNKNTELSIYKKNKAKVKKTKIEKIEYPIEEEKFFIFKEIIDRLIELGGRALYAQISTEMKNKLSDFIPKNYGFRNLSDMIDAVLPYLKEYKTCVDVDKTTKYLEKSLKQ